MKIKNNNDQQYSNSVACGVAKFLIIFCIINKKDCGILVISYTSTGMFACKNVCGSQNNGLQ